MGRLLHIAALAGLIVAGGIFTILSSCSEHSTPSSSAVEGSTSVQEGTANFDQALAELAVLELPDGADAEVFELLRGELDRQLRQHAADRSVSRAPEGLWNIIDDLEYEFSPDGSTIYSWTYKNVGDYDLNSEVSVADLTPIAINFGQTVQPGSPNSHVDGDGNGEINAADITPIALNFGVLVSFYAVEYSASPDGSNQWFDLGSVPFSAAGGQDGSPVFEFETDDFCPLQSVRVRPSDGTNIGIGSDGTEPEPLPEPEPPALTGTVTDTTDTPVMATVSIPGFDPVTADEQGRFVIDGIEPDSDYVLTFTADGFAETTINVETAGVLQQDVPVIMLPVELEQVIQTDSISIMETPSGASLVLEPGDLVDSSGLPMIESATASLTFIDVTDPVQRQAAPGDFTAVQLDETEVSLESFGMLNVMIEDAGGGEGNLGDGQDAPMTFPIAEDLLGTAPQEIGLYSFDEETGKWIEEGVAVLHESGEYYEAVVTHFSTWNADIPIETTAVHVEVTDLAGHAVERARVTAAGVDYTGNSYAYTNSEGVACLLVRVDSQIEVSATFYDSFSNLYTTVSPLTAGTCTDPENTPMVASIALDNVITHEPVGRINATPRQGQSPLVVTLDASESFDPDGGEIVAWEWDWDGEANGWSWQHETTPVVQHEFITDDDHVVVTVRVTDDEMQFAYASILICMHDGGFTGQ